MHIPEPSEIFCNLPEPASETYLRNLHQLFPEPSETFLRNLFLQPAPAYIEIYLG